MSELVTNLGADLAYIIRRELENLPDGRLTGAVTVMAAAEERVEEAPLPIEERWEWDRRQQSYTIEGDPSAPRIVGDSPHGAVYGFYRWLRDHGGCRWPFIHDCANPKGLPSEPLPTDRVTPDFAWRGFEGSLKKWDVERVTALVRWMMRNGWNLLLFNAAQWHNSPVRETLRELADLHGIRLVLGAHAVEQFLPAAMVDEHPEYFGMRDGVRAPFAKVPGSDGAGDRQIEIQPCYGNPATRTFLARRIAAFIDDNRGISAFSLWPHDGSNNWCECPACECDTPYRLMHELAREILEHARYPVPIEVLAYCNLLTPPTAPLGVEPRLYTLFCPYLRENRHRLDAPGFPPEKQRVGRGWPQEQPVNPVDEREYGRLFEEWLPHWRQSKSGLGIFAYYQLAFVDHTQSSDTSRYLYHPDLSLVEYELSLFRTAGAGAFYDCSWPNPGQWPDARFQEVLGRLLWDSSLDSAELESSYYQDTLGCAGEPVRLTLAKISAQLFQPDRPPLPEDMLEEARAVFSAAGEAAGRYLSWLEYLELADRSWQARKRNDRETLMAAEKSIMELLDREREELMPLLDIAWMERLSNGWSKLLPSTSHLK